MAVDIKLTYNEELGEYDIQYGQGDVYVDKTMLTSLLICLFTDRIADDDDVLPNKGDKRGYWGDLLEDDGSKTGSRLWLLRGKTDQQTLNQAKEYIKEAVQSFVTDGIWNYFDVITERQGFPPDCVLAFQIDAHYSNGQNVSYRFKGLWEEQLQITIN